MIGEVMAAKYRKSRVGKMSPAKALIQAKAFEMRLAGASYEQISHELGFKSASTGWKIVRRAIVDTLQEPAEEVLKLELGRIDRLLMAWWRTATGRRAADGSIIPPDGNATDRVLRILRQRHELLGLTELSIRTKPATNQDPIPDHHLAGMLRGLLEAAGEDKGPDA